MAWPLPLYELALMTAGRAYDMSIPISRRRRHARGQARWRCSAAGQRGVTELLADKGIRTITSGYAEIPTGGEIVVNPGDRRLQIQRASRCPSSYGPAVSGLPVSEHGFIRVDRFGKVPALGQVFAAGDAVDFAVKQGGMGASRPTPSPNRSRPWQAPTSSRGNSTP